MIEVHAVRFLAMHRQRSNFLAMHCQSQLSYAIDSLDCLTHEAEMNWTEELSGHIKAWISAVSGRTISSLHRKIERTERFEISYSMVKVAANGGHATNIPTALAILKTVLPTKEARKAFVEKHFIEYLDFAREFFEGDHKEAERPPSLSGLEARLFSRLMADLTMPIAQAKFFLGPSLYKNFISWLTYFKLGRESGDLLTLSGKSVVVEDFHAVKTIAKSTIDEIEPGKMDGDLLVLANGKASREAAHECWHIGWSAYAKCQEIIRNNPGDHTIVISNVMKFD